MDFYGIDRNATIGHCDSLALGRHDRDTRNISSWNRIRPEHVVDLLDNASADARGDARDLATMLSRFAWRISGGTASAQGSSNRIVNNVREITVSVAGRNFQLHCTETPSLKLERITA
ncbi:MAG TPA: hypothetical protein VFF71_11280 [Luteimonas sp.]|nr:hypothetical protein [Luteimonas sp.]